jgi:ribA/ribD-fused uncharacterized protein
MVLARIDSFEGKWAWLSNFHEEAFEFRGTLYPTAEHAYQDCKSHDPETWEVLDEEGHKNIMLAPTPGKAKRRGQEVQMDKRRWEQYKLDMMYAVVYAKFVCNPRLQRMLLDTDDAELVEGNWWGDRFWGTFRGAGRNHLGKILMRVRDELRQGSIFA